MAMLACASPPVQAETQENFLEKLKTIFENIDSLRDHAQIARVLGLELLENPCSSKDRYGEVASCGHTYTLLKSDGPISSDDFSYRVSKGVRLDFAIDHSHFCITKETIEGIFGARLRWTPPIHPQPFEHGSFGYRNANASIYFDFGTRNGRCVKKVGTFWESIDITKLRAP